MALLFEEPFATYVIVVPASHKRYWHAQGTLLDSRKFYIGSTTTSVHSRQDARVRKLPGTVYQYGAYGTLFSRTCGLLRQSDSSFREVPE